MNRDTKGLKYLNKKSRKEGLNCLIFYLAFIVTAFIIAFYTKSKRVDMNGLEFASPFLIFRYACVNFEGHYNLLRQSGFSGKKAAELILKDGIFLSLIFAIISVVFLALANKISPGFAENLYFKTVFSGKTMEIIKKGVNYRLISLIVFNLGSLLANLFYRTGSVQKTIIILVTLYLVVMICFGFHAGLSLGKEARIEFFGKLDPISRSITIFFYKLVAFANTFPKQVLTFLGVNLVTAAINFTILKNSEIKYKY